MPPPPAGDEGLSLGGGALLEALLLPLLLLSLALLPSSSPAGAAAADVAGFLRRCVLGLAAESCDRSRHPRRYQRRAEWAPCSPQDNEGAKTITNASQLGREEGTLPPVRRRSGLCVAVFVAPLRFTNASRRSSVQKKGEPQSIRGGLVYVFPPPVATRCGDPPASRPTTTSSTSAPGCWWWCCCSPSAAPPSWEGSPPMPMIPTSYEWLLCSCRQRVYSRAQKSCRQPTGREAKTKPRGDTG